MTEHKPGFIAQLTVIGQEGSRWVLNGDEQEIMINASEFDTPIELGDDVEVFLYMNRRGELTATSNIPTMTCESFGWGRVIRIDETEGAYVDIGSSFEVLVNKADLPRVKSVMAEDGRRAVHDIAHRSWRQYFRTPRDRGKSAGIDQRCACNGFQSKPESKGVPSVASRILLFKHSGNVPDFRPQHGAGERAASRRGSGYPDYRCATMTEH